MRRFDLPAWLLAAALHIAAVIFFFTVPLQAPWRKSTDVARESEPAGDTVMFVLGSTELRAKGPTIQVTPRDSAPPCSGVVQ